MIAIDKPNIIKISEEMLFYPFRYKQDDLDEDCGMFSRNNFIMDRTSTLEFQHSLFTMPYMR